MAIIKLSSGEAKNLYSYLRHARNQYMMGTLEELAAVREVMSQLQAGRVTIELDSDEAENLSGYRWHAGNQYMMGTSGELSAVSKVRNQLRD